MFQTQISVSNIKDKIVTVNIILFIYSYLTLIKRPSAILFCRNSLSVTKYRCESLESLAKRSN